MIVIADTTPLNYLILIGEVNVLHLLFEQVVIPPAVGEELSRSPAPDLVRAWIAAPPSWLEVRTPSTSILDLPSALGPGEREAIALAQELNADQLIVDDRPARHEAERRGFSVIGTLGVLEEAALEGYVDLESVIGRLKQTSFYIAPQLLERLLRLRPQRDPSA
jgi:predicted nucleic acid-binding protein